ALGFLLRARQTGRARYLYGAVGIFALALTAKENAILYPVAIGGAVLLLFDHRLFLARHRERQWTVLLIDQVVRTARGLWRWRVPFLVAAVELVVIVTFFYAPRSASPGGFGLWQGLADPTMIPRVIEAGTIDAGRTMVDSWVTGTHQDHPFLPFLGNYLKVLGTASGALALLAVLGFVTDRYSGDGPRDIVALGFYWGVASVIGYPIAIDIKSAWAVVHAVVPLAIPAAAGIALIYGWGVEALRDDDRVGVALATLVLVLVASHVAATGVSTVYLHPQQENNILVQYAQPEGEMRPALEAIHAAGTENQGGLDVMWYGEHFYVSNQSDLDRLPVRGGEWYNRLPMPWYLERFGVDQNSTEDPVYLADVVATERPPVVLTRDEEAGEISLEEDGYADYCYEFRQFDEDLVIYFDEGYTPNDPDAETRCDLNT
ncbi:MAG: TIGR03663 family protein, partial [Halobacteriales archaeon]|nr:TIGR03663 family protein [Halobacteriales archaeon]